MNRFAQQVWSKYRDDGQFQDIVETLMGAGISAGGQVLFTDMSPEDIALSTALGAGAAMAARPVAARIGTAAGKGLDRMFLNDPRKQDAAYGAVKEYFKDAIDGYRRIGMAPAADAMEAGLRAKYNQNYLRQDGSRRGFIEGVLTHQGRQRGDNIAQYGVALATPFLLGEDEEPMAAN